MALPKRIKSWHPTILDSNFSIRMATPNHLFLGYQCHVHGRNADIQFVYL
jgi:hypothetical protein